MHPYLHLYPALETHIQRVAASQLQPPFLPSTTPLPLSLLLQLWFFDPQCHGLLSSRLLFWKSSELSFHPQSDCPKNIMVVVVATTNSAQFRVARVPSPYPKPHAILLPRLVEIPQEWSLCHCAFLYWYPTVSSHIPRKLHHILDCQVDLSPIEYLPVAIVTPRI